MIPEEVNPARNGPRLEAQQAADRIRILRNELTSGEVQSVLALTPDQRQRFDDWSREKLAELAARFDVDTTASQKRVSWGMRIASTLGAVAICFAIVLFFMRYWGYLETWEQLAAVIATPLILLAGTEVVARRERTHYFTGLLALAALAGFVLNLAVVGTVFNIVPTEWALLAWGAFAILLAYRYGLRLMLALGLLLLMGYITAALSAYMGYDWQSFYERPEDLLLLGLLVFGSPFFSKRLQLSDFAAVYRLVGAVTCFIAILSLAEWGAQSYLAWSGANVERLYGVFGLFSSAIAIWLGIQRNWDGVVNTGAAFFTIFLISRLYHWWWDWMPKYLFFALIGALGILLVIAFKQVRRNMAGQAIA